MQNLFKHLEGDKKRWLSIGWLLSGLLAFGCVSATAQTTGTIVGTVRDNTGAVIPGATVTITETSMGTAVKYTTDAAGAYNAPLLIPGTYSVAVQKNGFQQSVHPGVVVQTSSTQRVDVVLQIGSVTQTVSVTTQTQLVDTESADVGQVIASGQPQVLPLNGRDYFQLALLVPAVTPGTPTSALSGQSSNVPRGDSDFNAFGMSDGANSMLVDGIDNQEYTFGAGILEPDLEAVKEFKVETGYFSAQYGRGAGVVMVSTNSGTNDFHGNLFEFVRNSAVDAKLYFTQPGVSQPFRRNQFGAALGGPVLIPKLYNGRNRTFFFIETAFERQLLADSTVDTVPTAQTRLGNFQGYETANGTPITIYDPNTTQLNPAYNPSQPVSASNPQYVRSPFPNNSMVGSGELNQAGLNLASIYPLPNGPGFTNNYTSEVENTYSDNNGSVRIDEQITDRNKLFGRWSYETLALNTPIGGAGVATAMATPAAVQSKFDLGPYVSGGQVTTLVDAGLAIDDSQVITSSLVNDFLTGYARLNPHTLQSDYGLNPATALGIQGVNLNQATSGLPNLSVTNYTGINDGADYFPLNNIETVLQWQDTLFWTHKNQNVSVGSRWVLREASPFVQSNRGSISFATNFTNNPATNSGGDGLATMLLGAPTSASRGVTPYRSYYHLGEYGTFVEDDVKLSRRLTVNLGVRWDVFAPPRSLNNRMANFDTVGLQMIYPGINGNDHTNIQTRWNNVGPRVGFEWDLFGDAKTVVRGGYGIVYFPAMAAYSANGQLGLNVPFIFSQSYTEPTNPTASQYAALPTISQPFTTPVTIQPIGTAALQAAAPTVIGWELSNKTPSAESYTLNIQHQVTPSMLLEVGYGGSQGRQLVSGLNLNEVEPGTGSNASRRLIQPLSNLTTITDYRQRGRSNWNGLMVKINQRTSHGLAFLFSYTYGKARDCTDPQSITFSCAASYGYSSYNVKHRAVGSAIWDLPGSNLSFRSNGVLGGLAGGWQLTGIVTGTTGIPFQPTLNAGVNNGAPSWPNQVGSCSVASRSLHDWFNVSAFVAPPANTYGNMRAYPCPGPGSFSIDSSLVKQTQVRENLALQLRLEAYNLFNHPFFGLPNAVIGGASAGIISSTANNIITDAGDNRNLEGAIRFVF